MSLRNRIACMIAPALVRFARARALRSSLFVVAYNYFKSSCHLCDAVECPGAARPGAGRGGAAGPLPRQHAAMAAARHDARTMWQQDVVVTRGRRAGPS
jgi:hypothetical protein